VEYEEIIESLCYEYRGLYKSNYQEDLITMWYQWIGLIYRDHPFVYKTLRALQLINNDPFFEDFDTGYKVIEHADITEAIHTAETGLKVIAVYSVLENTTNRDNLEFLNCVIQSNCCFRILIRQGSCVNGRDLLFMKDTGISASRHS
jgi:hypothetical protein